MKGFWHIIGMGMIAGMRSMAAPAIVSDYLAQRPWRGLIGLPFSLLSVRKISQVLKLFALGEMIGDKIPGVPHRISFPALLGRGLSGIVVGATVGAVRGNNRNISAIAGGLAAIAAAYGSYHLRIAASKHLQVPDPVIGAVEDALVIGSGIGLLELTPESA